MAMWQRIRINGHWEKLMDSPPYQRGPREYHAFLLLISFFEETSNLAECSAVCSLLRGEASTFTGGGAKGDLRSLRY